MSVAELLESLFEQNSVTVTAKKMHIFCTHLRRELV